MLCFEIRILTLDHTAFAVSVYVKMLVGNVIGIYSAAGAGAVEEAVDMLRPRGLPI
jgi:hypothetical protein